MGECIGGLFGEGGFDSGSSCLVRRVRILGSFVRLVLVCLREEESVDG